MGLLGLDNYYETLLNEAKSPEELKKILTYQYVQNKGVPEEVLDSILEIDPTKKKTYTRWTLNFWDDNQKEITNSLKMGKLQEMFNYFKERSVATPENPKGLSLVDMKSFEQAMNMLPDADPVFGHISDNPKAEDYDVVFDLPGIWRIAVPHTFEADKKLGQGCKWCTAGAFGDPNNPHYWDYYSAEGPLWINFDFRGKEVCPMDNKEYPYKRYQFLFEHNQFGGELCDCHDRRVDFDKIKMPEEAIDFYTKQDKRYGMICQGLDIRNEARNEFLQFRRQHITVLKEFEDGTTISIKLGPSMEDFTRGIYRYFVFSSEDEQDPITETYDQYTVNPEDYMAEGINDKLTDCKNALAVKLNNGSVMFVYLDDNMVDKKIITNENVLSLENRLLFFYGSNEEKTLFRCYDDVEKLFTTVMTKNSGEISMIKNTRLNESSYAIEFVNNENHHILVTIQNNCLSEILQNDSPINGKFYEIKQDSENFYVIGKHFKHWLFGANDITSGFNADNPSTEDDFSGDNCHVLEELSAKVYIIETDNKQYLNLYNPETKKFYSNRWFTKIIKPNNFSRVLTCMADVDLFNIEKCIFDIDSLEFKTPLLAKGRSTDNYFYGFVPSTNTIKLYDFETKQIYSLDGVSEVLPLNLATNEIIVVKNTSGNIIVWAFKQNKTGLEDFHFNNIDWEPTTPYQSHEFPGVHYLYRASTDNNYSVLLDLNTCSIVISNVKRIDYSPDEKWTIIGHSDPEQGGQSVFTAFDNEGNVIVKNSSYINYTYSYLVVFNDMQKRILCIDQNGQIKRTLDRPSNVRNIDVDYHRNYIIFYYLNGPIVTYSIDENQTVHVEGNLSSEEADANFNAQAQAVKENFKKIYNKLLN